MTRSIPAAAMLILLTAASGPVPAHEAAFTHDSPEAAVSMEGRLDDLAVFRKQFLARDRSYSKEARAEAEARLSRLEAAAGAMSEAAFELEIARIVALADNGHTAFFAGPRSRSFNRVGIRLVPFGPDFYVLRAIEAHGDLLGARLAAIDGKEIATIREVAHTLAGGTPSFRDRSAPYFLESPEQMHAMGVIPSGDAAIYRFETGEGRAIERRLVADPPDPARPRANAERWMYPDRLDSEPSAWRTLLPADRAPWALQDPKARFRWRQAPELDAVVVELRANTDAGGESIGRFLEEVTGRIKKLGPRNLVLDMRMNSGGDLNDTRDFVQSLPRLVPGSILALTSPWTFSAAISTIGYLEQSAPDRVTIVGEEVGDRLQMWAEGSIVELPHSHAMILNATERHDYLTGCRPFDDCHGPVVRHPISVPTLAPDIPAPWTIEDYRAGVDPAMEAVAVALRSDP